MSLFGEFLRQIILVIFYLLVICVAVRLGINMAKKKKNTDENKEG